MDLIESIRHMMAEENFSGAEEALETVLSTSSHQDRNLLVSLYLEVLLQQKKNLPDHLVAEVISGAWDSNNEFALALYENSQESLRQSSDSRVLFFKMKLYEKRGQLRELHQLVSSFHLRLYERNLPSIPVYVDEIVKKYFKTDFQLRLQIFALLLLRKDHANAEIQLQSLVLEIFERTNVKVVRQKLEAIDCVLSALPEKGPFEIYHNLIHILLEGFAEKKDFKKLAEAIIYFDDFRFNVILMNILHTHHHEDMAAEYANELSLHKQYDFVYIAKHFPELKKYFVTITSPQAKAESWETPDLTLSDKPATGIHLVSLYEHSAEGESLLIQLIRGQEFSDAALLDLAVSFVQSELPRVAVASSMIVHERAQNKKLKLKAAYLALTALLLSGDYRRALDLALDSMKDVSTTDDLLSFLYCEAEAYLRLNMRSEAKQVLQKIVSIDSRYRMARERLEKL